MSTSTKQVIAESAAKTLSIDIDGQPKASQLASGYVETFIAEGAHKAALICGPAGVGKSNLTDAIISLATTAGINVHYIAVGSLLSRSESPDLERFIDILRDSASGAKSVVIIDEAQSLPIKLGANLSPAQRVFSTLIYGSGQGWPRFGELEFLGKPVAFNTANLLFILVTNQPEKIGGYKSNPDAFNRRFLKIPLVKYTAEKMKQLIPVYFQKKGWKCGADAATAISNLHRGTFAPLDGLLGVATTQIADRVIKKSDLAALVPLCEHTLRGFTWLEIAALIWIGSTNEPTKKTNLSAKFPDLNADEWYRHAQDQMVKRPKAEGMTRAPFIIMNKLEYALTDTGFKFLLANADILNIEDQDRSALAHKSA